MISHDNVTWTTKNVFDTLSNVNHTDRIVSYLPLSHIAAQMIDLHGPMCVGCCTYFARPDALKGSIKATLCDVRPTIFFGVPRVWEKFQDAIVELGRKSSPILKTISGFAKGVGKSHCEMMQYGNGGGAPCFYGCAGLILNKIKTGLGLDQCKACFTAAAPIAPETLWYFASLDIPVYEVFGQSECTGPHTLSYDAQWKIGACGRPLKGTVSKGDANSELCYSGRHILMGYMYMPEKTAETIDEEGWLHSGDIGEFDSDTQPGMKGPSGFLKITGRIKELKHKSLLKLTLCLVEDVSSSLSSSQSDSI
jgi:long-chain-fatty-acid--CoA ligase ACSBG